MPPRWLGGPPWSRAGCPQRDLMSTSAEVRKRQQPTAAQQLWAGWLSSGLSGQRQELESRLVGGGAGRVGVDEGLIHLPGVVVATERPGAAAGRQGGLDAGSGSDGVRPELPVVLERAGDVATLFLACGQAQSGTVLEHVVVE